MPRPRREHHILSAKTLDLLRRSQAARAGGAGAGARGGRGGLPARARLDALLDDDSFQELDLLASSRAGPGDGVVAGLGRVHGRDVCVYAQDPSVLGGTLGLAGAMKVCKVLDLAVDSGVPVIGLLDSGGARVQEGVDALAGYAEVLRRNVRASGRVPQLAAVLGPCSGGAAFSPAIADFVFMVEGSSRMYITSPEVARSAAGEELDGEDLGGAQAHSQRSGACHFSARSEQDCLRQMRELIEFLPQNCMERPGRAMTSDSPARKSDVLGRLAAMDRRQPYRVHSVIWEIADLRSFFEVHRGFAQNLAAGFVRLDGEPVGVVANNPMCRSGALDISASEKAARFVRFCGAFNIPILTLVDAPGYLPGAAQEHAGLIRKGAGLVYAYAEAPSPKVTVILRKAYGGAYGAMGSRHLGADLVFAWPCAEIAVMGPSAAGDALFAADPYVAAQKGYVDEVIDPAETRLKVIRALGFLRGKAAAPAARKPGNPPL